MKLFIKFIFLAIAISMMAIGCKKENQEIISVSEINTKLKEAGMRFLYCLYYTDPYTGTQYVLPLFCAWPPSNCLPTVVIYGNAPEDSNPKQVAIEKAFENFTTALENGNVEQFFETDQCITLFPKLREFPDVLSGIVNSKIFIHHDVGDDGLDYYICLRASVDYLSDWRGQQECVFVIDNQTD